jgi:hypothetical protein
MEPIEVEAAVLGCLLNEPGLADQLWGNGIVPDHFGGDLGMLAATMFALWGKHRPCNPNEVVLALTETGQAQQVTASQVFHLYQNAHPSDMNTFTRLVARLDEERQRRKVIKIATQMVQVASTSNSDFGMMIADLSAKIVIAMEGQVVDPLAHTQSLGDLLATDFTDSEYIVPDLLRSRSRTVITGPEGFGKSELLYQIALCTSVGLHPFEALPIPAQRVLVVDGENESADLKDRLRRMIVALRELSPHSPEFRLETASGWNLLDAHDAAHLFGLCRAYQPGLLVIGPIYQIMDGDVNDAEIVRRFTRVIDECRRICNCAVIAEAHANNEYQGKRDWRPSGSAVWRRWPEFGIGLQPLTERGEVMELHRWRGDRHGAKWPDKIRRGSLLPWQPDY